MINKKLIKKTYNQKPMTGSTGHFLLPREVIIYNGLTEQTYEGYNKNAKMLREEVSQVCAIFCWLI